MPTFGPTSRWRCSSPGAGRGACAGCDWRMTRCARDTGLRTPAMSLSPGTWRSTVTVMEPASAAPCPPAAGALYDARRGVYYAKPVLRGWLHLLWFAASLVSGALLLARAHGASRIAAIAIYAASVSALFGISAPYHRGNWSAAWSRRLQRLDHAMIFFLIAGTDGGRRDVHRAGLGGRCCAARGVDPGRCRGGSADGRGRPAVHGRSDFLSSPLARPVPVGVRLPRGLSRLRLRRRHVPVRRDNTTHPLNRACRLPMCWLPDGRAGGAAVVSA